MIFPAEAQAAIDGKAKPPGSLGTLEEWGVRLSVLQGTLSPKVTDGVLVVFAADHGVTEMGVSPYPSSVTRSIFRSLVSGGAAGAVLARSAGVDVDVVDVGVKDPIDGDPCASKGGRDMKIKAGTGNIARGPAMTVSECRRAMEAGAEVVTRHASKMSETGLAIMLGEVGIGNTTSSAALLSALTGATPTETCGRGTGLDDKGVARKVAVVEEALALHQAAVTSGDGFKILSALGGLETAALVGAMLQAWELRLPVLVDGFTVTTAATVALRISPGRSVQGCLFLATRSAEKGFAIAAGALRQEEGEQGEGGEAPAMRPALDMGLRLGEGTAGAVLAYNILKGAADIMSSMVSLEDALA
ncbi:unnamed protein product [Discosporangium mesarthrocarpum]